MHSPLETGRSQTPTDLQSIERFQAATAKLRAELGKVIVGQQEVVDQLLIALFAGGHCI